VALTGQLQFRRAPRKENLEQLAMTEQRVQVGGGGVNQEQNEDPDLDRGKTMPGEMRRHIFRIAVDPTATDKILDDLFQKPRQEHDRPVHDRLKQDRLNKWSVVEPT